MGFTRKWQVAEICFLKKYNLLKDQGVGSYAMIPSIIKKETNLRPGQLLFKIQVSTIFFGDKAVRSTISDQII